MLKVVIVDDTRANQEIVKGYFGMMFPDSIEICGMAIDVQPAMELMLECNPDLVILDIQLKTGTGFDLLDGLLAKNIPIPEVIFITAYGKYEYATKAFEYSAIDFLTKPIDPDKFQISIQRAIAKIGSTGRNEPQIKMLLDHVRGGGIKHTKMAFHRVKGLIEFIEVDRILYCEADGSLTKVFLEGGEVVTVMRHLGHYSNILVQDFSFYPISNKTIVNMDYVKSYNHSELALLLTTGQVVYASRRGGADFRKLLNE